jgi:hypothetical protein
MSTITLKYLLTSRNQNTIIELSKSFPNSGSYIKCNQIFSFYSYSVLTQPQIGCVFRPSPFTNSRYNPSTGEAPSSAMSAFLGSRDIEARCAQEEQSPQIYHALWDPGRHYWRGTTVQNPTLPWELDGLPAKHLFWRVFILS